MFFILLGPGFFESQWRENRERNHFIRADISCFFLAGRSSVTSLPYFRRWYLSLFLSCHRDERRVEEEEEKFLSSTAFETVLNAAATLPRPLFVSVLRDEIKKKRGQARRACFLQSAYRLVWLFPSDQSRQAKQVARSRCRFSFADSLQFDRKKRRRGRAKSRE